MRFRTRAAALTALALGLIALPPQLAPEPASAATAPVSGPVSVDERRAVPANGTVAIQGRGFGHGRGMSQHGAEGAARVGLSHERILAFYYPGTKLEKATKQLKVLITADTSSDVVVLNRSGLRVADFGTSKLTTLPQDLGATQWRTTTDAQNRNVLQYRVGSSWRSWPGLTTFRGTPEFRGGGTVDLVLPGSKVVRYRGAVRAARPSATSTLRDTVNVLPLDSYVKGVVAREMPASWSPEAVQAQSVAARTYAAYHQGRSAGRHYDVDDTTRYQVYGGLTGEHPLGNAAVDATARQVLTYRGTSAFTEFSASSGGWTVASTIPYQVSKADPYDGWSGNGNRAWTTTVTRAAIQRVYPQVGTLQAIRVSQRDGQGAWGGRVVKLALEGSKGTKWLTGDQFRISFGLKSTWVRF